jgi:hypothetical protein
LRLRVQVRGCSFRDLVTGRAPYLRAVLLLALFLGASLLGWSHGLEPLARATHVCDDGESHAAPEPAGEQHDEATCEVCRLVQAPRTVGDAPPHLATAEAYGPLEPIAAARARAATARRAHAPRAPPAAQAGA